MLKYDSVIFDMDGTLLQTEKVAVPAFKMTFDHLRKDGKYNGETPSEDQLISWLGFTLDKIWDGLLPNASYEIKHLANHLMLEYELQILDEGKGELYPGVLETLKELNASGLALFVASNGLDDYIRGVCKSLSIYHLFKDLYSAGRFQIYHKEELVKKLVKDYQLRSSVMVGDRKSDIIAGKKNHLFTIGCDYGFANDEELKEANVIIQHFDELIPLILG
ncbi:HAD hydrolase-like protein [Microaerobacter geothermalis]|uniref:HAD hydrolase-like protein n=1 Tax=Microaerobacter geothermalis TaxID=674972 RepID=UPI001F450D02|nr:HAD hydrolase-like protein [Microaerobacter geothermalis]MCF6095193.1 HAD hydrolase-like protein [Microaerobacter geothermalis]